MTEALTGLLVTSGIDVAVLTAITDSWIERGGRPIEWQMRIPAAAETPSLEGADISIFAPSQLGQLVDAEALRPLDVFGREAERNAMSQDSIGPSYESYAWHGRQWAFPVTASALVTAWRADRVASPPGNWQAVLELARQGLVVTPLIPPHNLFVFYTLCANRDHACAIAGDTLIDPEHGAAAVAMMRELCALLPEECRRCRPADVLDLLTGKEGRTAVMAFGLGDARYATAGFRPHSVRFTNLPITGHADHVGATLTGAGVAVPKDSADPNAATEFAYWLASGDVQKTILAQAGGQPAHAAAWEFGALNASCGQFYRSIRETLDGSWAPPRFAGYPHFEQSAAERLDAALMSESDPAEVVVEINRLFADSN